MPHSILIVEKNDYEALKITEYLRTAEFEVNRVKSGQLGIGTLRTTTPNLLILSDDLNDLDTATFLERMINMVVPDNKVDLVVKTIIKVNKTGSPGDGKIFVESILDAVRVRTGEAGDDAIVEQEVVQKT